MKVMTRRLWMIPTWLHGTIITHCTEPTSSELLRTPSLASKYDLGADATSTDEEWGSIRMYPTTDV
jgi:hypothetical protein